MENRRGWIALGAGGLLCALGFRLVDPARHLRETLDALGGVSMGLAIFVTFILATISESNRRESSGLFPTRLFTLPVSTFTLALAPIAFGVLGVSVVYVVWARLLWPALGRVLPLDWPLLYLATAMACYQATLWALARLPKIRLLVVGTGGTLFAVGWLLFRDDFAGTTQLADWLGLPGRAAWCGLLWMLLLGALALGFMAVEAQRRGGWTRLGWWRWTWPKFSRRLFETLLDSLAPARRRLNSPQAAQLWFEWRRHGLLLPVATFGLLLIIMMPALWLSPLSADTTTLTVSWVLLMPLLLAFAFGQGFGKADLWSKQPAMSLFFATRPLSVEDRIGAKMKAGLLASATSWLLVIILTPLWVCGCGDWESLARLWATATALYPGATLWLLPPLVVVCLILLTWRLLVGSLYVGFSARNWLFGVAACGVFAAVLGAPLTVLALNQQPDLPRKLLRVPSWLPWVLALLFSVKVGLAFIVAIWARRRGWLSPRALNRYLAIWMAVTASLFVTAWLVGPVQGWMKWSLAWLALLAMPLLRAAYAPVALARSRGR